MSGLAATCPGCAASVIFSAPGSAVAVCPVCQTLVARADAANLGKMADLQQGETPLRLGAMGRHCGVAFVLVGHTRLKSGEATWDEWYAYFTSRASWGWLSYAQGQYYILFQSSISALPPFDTLMLDAPVRLGTETFSLAQRGTASYIAAAGELPFIPDSAKAWRFADFRGRKRAFATISEYDVPTLYVGVRTTLTALDMEALPRSATTQAVSSRRVACPSCGGTLELHTGALAFNVACVFCGALLDVRKAALKVLQEAIRRPSGLDLPLGKQGMLAGIQWRIVGYMVRKTMVDGETFSWEEYLLHEPAHGFRWLMQSDGHWTFVQPAEDIEGDESKGFSLHATRFRSFQRCTAEVTYVLGEFYWPVKVGEKVDILDCMAAPLSLSRERANEEEIWSLGTYVPHREIARAFGVGVLPRVKGVAPNQPWPHRGYGVVAAALCLLAWLLYGVLGLTRSVVASEHFFEIHKDQVLITQSFATTGSRNASVNVYSDGGTTAVDGTWVKEFSEGSVDASTAGPDVDFAMDVEAGNNTTVYFAKPAHHSAHLRLAVRDVDGPVSALTVTVYESDFAFQPVLTTWVICTIWVICMFFWQLKFAEIRWRDANV